MSIIKKIDNNLVLINSQQMDNNCYLLIDKNCVIIIDPSYCANAIQKIINQNKYKVLAILLTHAHFDHSHDTKQLIDLYHCPVYLHKKDKITYEKYDCSDLIGSNVPKFDKNIIYFDNKNLKIQNFKINVIVCPGHTLGSVVYIWNNYVFSGDTLFSDSYGRSDFAGGSINDLVKSLKYLFDNIDNDCLILPGHGPYDKFNNIKQNNFAFKQLINEKN